MEKSTALFDKEKAQERLSKLSGGVAVFKVYSAFVVSIIFCVFFMLSYLILYFLIGWRS